MTAITGLAAGLAVCALIVTIQTLRLRAAKKATAQALAAADDGREAIASAQLRQEAERKLAGAWKAKYQGLHDQLHLELAEYEKRATEIQTWTDGVKDAAGDDDATLAVLRNALRVGRPMPQREPGDSQGG